MIPPAPAPDRTEGTFVAGSTMALVAAAWFVTLELWQSAGFTEACVATLVGAPAFLLLRLGWRAPRRDALWVEVLLCASLALPASLLLGFLVFLVLVVCGLALSPGVGAEDALRPATLVVSLPVAVAGSSLLVCTLGVLWLRARRTERASAASDP